MSLQTLSHSLSIVDTGWTKMIATPVSGEILSPGRDYNPAFLD